MRIGNAILLKEAGLQPEPNPANHAPSAEPERARAEFRVAEKLSIAFFLLELAGSTVFPLPDAAKLRGWGLSFLALGLLLVVKNCGTRSSGKVMPELRDWYPCLLIPLAYRASGVFFIPDPRHRLDQVFEAWDVAVLRNSVLAHGLAAGALWLGPAIEISYFLCYPMVPLALLSVVLALRPARLGESTRTETHDPVDRFWTTVLLSVFFCYIIYPLFPLTPPRVLFPGVAGVEAHSALRTLNLWMLHQNGDQASLFPSGHVAGVVAAALAVRARLPRMGWVFLLAAASVTLATFVGRYHYAADAIAGVLVAAAVSQISNSLVRKLVR